MSRGFLALLFSTISTLAFAAPGDTPLSPPIPIAGAATSSGGTPGGSSGQLQYNASGSFGGVPAVNGDGTLNTSTGALVVTETNGTAFGALATVTPGTGVATALGNATGAASGFPVLATGGYLAAAQEPAFTGDVTKSAGSVATTVLSTNGTAFGALATVTPGTGIATALANNAGANGAVLINGNVNTVSTTIKENGNQVQFIETRSDTSLANASVVSQFIAQGYDNAGTPVLNTWSDIQTEALVTTGTTANETQMNILLNSGSTQVNSIVLTPASIVLYTNTVGGGAGVAAVTINSSQVVRLNSAGTAAAPSLGVGNATTGLYSVSTTGLGHSVNGTLVQDYGITHSGATTIAGVAYFSAGISNGSAPTLTSGSCSGSSWAGGATTGTFTAASCAAGTYIISAMPTVTTGYACDAFDRTTVADTVVQTASTTSSATFKSTTASSDVIQVHCFGY